MTHVTDGHYIDMLNRLEVEIKNRDRQIAELAPPAEAYHRLCQVLDLNTGRRGGVVMSNGDILYTISRERERIKHAIEDEAQIAAETAAKKAAAEAPQPIVRKVHKLQRSIPIVHPDGKRGKVEIVEAERPE